MKLFKPWVIKEYGKYFKSDEILINKIVINNIIANDESKNLVEIFAEKYIYTFLLCSTGMKHLRV